MAINETAIPGVLEITSKVFEDSRGWFMESFSQKQSDIVYVQDNHSFSLLKGTLRGLHCQIRPFAQAKLMLVITGAAMDVVVDARRGSPMFGKWITTELSEENKKQLFIPHGCLHGFVTLRDNTRVAYKCDNYYSPEHERAVLWNDPFFGIDWGVVDPVISPKDAAAPLFKDSDVDFIWER